MRILFLNYEYPPLGGGAANATAYILNEFQKVPDLTVDLVTSSIDSDYHLDKLGNNIFIHRLPIGKNEKNLHYQSQKDLMMYSWKAWWFSRKLVKKNRYDLSHSFFTVPCGFLSLLIHKFYRLPYIVSLRGSDVPGYSERFKSLYVLIRTIVRLIWKNAKFVVSNSQGLKELANQTNPNQNIEIIYNGVDTEDFYPEYSRRDVGKFLITVGASRITARKGIKYLIEAVKILSARYDNIFLKIMGEGNEKHNLELLTKELGLEDKISFIGRVPREETTKYYQEADVFVLPSANEGMSNAMLEALACGLPILATMTGGTEELLIEGVNGMSIRMKDPEDIAKKLEILINDRQKSGSMGLESRKIAEANSWKSVAERYNDLYKKSSQ